ncbi:MAG: glycosyltransferase family 2 protein [Acidobacteriota bacterium]|nr:glycosyltransferase family 2 protein [Acidobacteriota bacterium]
MTAPSISILILTKNEEQDLPAALASVAGLNGEQPDDIHVFDSQSTDRTQEIARAAGAHVTERAFDNWAAHQNWGLAHISFRYPWVLYIDADEVVTPELRASILAAVQHPGETVAFRVQRRDFFEGTWLKHVQTSPFYLRLFRPDKMRYERLVNPLSIPDGPVGQVSGFLDHFPFSKGVGYWLDRHNKYATFEAQQIVANRHTHAAAGGAPFSPTAAFTERDFHKRRYHQKELFYRLPARPLIKFLILYIAKRGFLDGRAGLRYSILQSIYEYMIVLKTDELAGIRVSS